MQELTAHVQSDLQPVVSAACGSALLVNSVLRWARENVEQRSVDELLVAEMLAIL